MDAVRKWSHFLHGKHFTLITNQRAVPFVFDPSRLGKNKNMHENSDLAAEPGNYDYKIKHPPGKENWALDPLSRLSFIATTNVNVDLLKIHEQLGHPGISRLSHFVRIKDLQYLIPLKM